MARTQKTPQDSDEIRVLSILAHYPAGGQASTPIDSDDFRVLGILAHYPAGGQAGTPIDSDEIRVVGILAHYPTPGKIPGTCERPRQPQRDPQPQQPEKAGKRSGGVRDFFYFWRNHSTFHETVH